MSLYRENSRIQAAQATLLGELFDWFSSLPDSNWEVDRIKFLLDIGEALDFNAEYVTEAILRKPHIEVK